MTEITIVASTVPRDTYAKTLVTSKKQVQGKDHVQLYCNEDPTKCSPKSGQLLRDVRSVTRVAVTDIANVVSTLPKDTYAKTLVTSNTQVQGKDHVHFTAMRIQPASDLGIDYDQKWAIPPRMCGP